MHWCTCKSLSLENWYGLDMDMDCPNQESENWFSLLRENMWWTPHIILEIPAHILCTTFEKIGLNLAFSRRYCSKIWSSESKAIHIFLFLIFVKTCGEQLSSCFEIPALIWHFGESWPKVGVFSKGLLQNLNLRIQSHIFLPIPSLPELAWADFWQVT